MRQFWRADTSSLLSLSQNQILRENQQRKHWHLYLPSYLNVGGYTLNLFWGGCCCWVTSLSHSLHQIFLALRSLRCLRKFPSKYFDDEDVVVVRLSPSAQGRAAVAGTREYEWPQLHRHPLDSFCCRVGSATNSQLLPLRSMFGAGLLYILWSKQTRGQTRWAGEEEWRDAEDTDEEVDEANERAGDGGGMLFFFLFLIGVKSTENCWDKFARTYPGMGTFSLLIYGMTS